MRISSNAQQRLSEEGSVSWIRRVRLDVPLPEGCVCVYFITQKIKGKLGDYTDHSIEYIGPHMSIKWVIILAVLPLWSTGGIFSESGDVSPVFSFVDAALMLNIASVLCRSSIALAKHFMSSCYYVTCEWPLKWLLTTTPKSFIIGWNHVKQLSKKMYNCLILTCRFLGFLLPTNKIKSEMSLEISSWKTCPHSLRSPVLCIFISWRECVEQAWNGSG